MTLAASWPSPGNRWGFRLSVVILAIIAAGIGASFLEERASRSLAPKLRRALGAPIGAAIALCGLLAPAARESRMPQAELQNYVFLRDTLERLRQTEWIGLVLAPEGFLGPRNAATSLARLLRIPVVTARAALEGPVDPDLHWYFYRDLACFAWRVPELSLGKEATDADVKRWLDESEDHWITMLFRPETRFGFDSIIRRDVRERPSCEMLSARSESVGLLGPLLITQLDPPQTVYLVPSVTPELRRWVSAAPPSDADPPLP